MSRDFNGSTQYAARADGLGLTGYGVTIAGWVRLDALPSSGNYLTPFGMADDPSPTNAVYVSINSGGSVGGGVAYSGVWTGGMYTSNALSTGTWAHIAVVLTSTANRRTVLNGDYANSGTSVINVSGFPPGMDITEIGRWVDGSEYVNGQMAHWSVWNTALTQAEVEALAAGDHPYTVRRRSLQAYWSLAGDDSPEPDDGPHQAYPLTLYNSPTQGGSDPTVDAPPTLMARTSRDIDGSSSYLSRTTVPSAIAGTTTPTLTFAGWMKLDATSGATGDQCPVNLLRSSGADQAIGSYIPSGTSNFIMEWTGNDGGECSASNNALGLTQWRHVALIYSPTAQACVIDGNWSARGTSAKNNTLYNALTDVALGAGPGFVYRANAKYAHWAIWDTTLTQAEVEGLAGGDNPLAVQATNLQAYWPLPGNDSPSTLVSLNFDSGSPTTDFQEASISAAYASGAFDWGAGDNKAATTKVSLGTGNKWMRFRVIGLSGLISHGIGFANGSNSQMFFLHGVSSSNYRIWHWVRNSAGTETDGDITLTGGTYSSSAYCGLTYEPSTNTLRMWYPVTAAMPDSVSSWDSSAADGSTTACANISGCDYAGFYGWTYGDEGDSYDDFTTGTFGEPDDKNDYDLTLTGSPTQYAGAPLVNAAAVAVSRVGTGWSNSETPQTNTISIDVTPNAAGNLLVAIIKWEDANRTLSSVSDNNGNTWTIAVQKTYDTTSYPGCAIAYANNVNSGATTITATLSGVSYYRTIVVDEFSGLHDTTPEQGTEQSSQGTSADYATPSITTDSAGVVIIGIADTNALSNWSGTAGTPDFAVGKTAIDAGLLYYICNAETVTPGGSADGNTRWVTVAQAFKTEGATSIVLLIVRHLFGMMGA